jgi:hypothetical protein
MKSTVKDELTIPQQTRYLVPIELGRVERHVSTSNFCAFMLSYSYIFTGLRPELRGGFARARFRRSRYCSFFRLGGRCGIAAVFAPQTEGYLYTSSG